MVHFIHFQPDYHHIAEYCNTWRNYDYIQDSWSSVLSIINFYVCSQTTLV